MGKPERINEVQWSKRGWSCVGKERVGCVGGCGKEVVIKLEEPKRSKEDGEEQGDSEDENESWRDEAQQQLVGKYAEIVSTGHEGSCLWRRRGCDGISHPSSQNLLPFSNLRVRILTILSQTQSNASP